MSARRSASPSRRTFVSGCLLLLVLSVGWPGIASEPAQPAPAEQPALTESPKDLAALQALQSQVQEVVAKVLPCTVGVQIGSSRGSGVIVSEDGYVMTAGHVVGKPGQDVTFFFADGKKAKGKTLGLFKSTDAGLMKIEDEGKWPFVEKGRSRDLAVGTWCLATGHPFGYRSDRPPVVRVGRVLRNGQTVIQSDCPLVAGDSGGPLFDLEGRVIGINSRIGPKADINLHVPVDIFLDHWDRLVKGEEWEVVMHRRDDDDVKVAFRDVVADAGDCVVRVKVDGKDAALGTIVGPDGWIVTKASELKGKNDKVVCRLRGGDELPARVVGLDEAFDLAMLKVDRTDLPLIEFSTDEPEVGQWLATLGLEDKPLALGVLSVPEREIPPTPGLLGVMLKEGDDGPEVETVLPKTAAEKAGLKVKDVITHVDGKAVSDRETLIETVRGRRPGEKVKLQIRRDGKKIEITATLGKPDTPGTRKRDMQNQLGGELSDRREDFPAVLQHDTVLAPADCGGPVVDLEGEVVGVNIARGGRTETYCVSGAVMKGRMYDLMSGRLSPKRLAEQKAEEERKRAEAEKKAEEERKKAEAAAKKVEAERKKAEAAKKAEAERKKAEEEAKRKEEERKKAEAVQKAEEEGKKAEQAKREEEEAAKKAEEERKKAEEAKRAEEERKKAEEAKKAEEERKDADEAKPADEEDKTPEDAGKEEQQPEPQGSEE